MGVELGAPEGGCIRRATGSQRLTRGGLRASRKEPRAACDDRGCDHHIGGPMQQHDQGSPFGLDDARAFIVKARWTYATSLAEHPHEYLARARLTPELQAGFDAFVALIERDGYTGRFWGS